MRIWRWLVKGKLEAVAHKLFAAIDERDAEAALQLGAFVLRRDDGEWRIVLFHSIPLPQ